MVKVGWLAAVYREADDSSWGGHTYDGEHRCVYGYKGTRLESERK